MSNNRFFHFSKRSFRSYFCLLLLVFSFSSHFFAQNPNPDTDVDDFISDEMNTQKIPGMATLILKDGEIVWNKSYGFANIDNNKKIDDNTIFLLASLSKVFTGTALMKLKEDGLINLDDAINDYLPFSIKNPNFQNTPITFKMLLTHTASIDENDAATDDYYSVGDPTITLADAIKRYFSTTGSDYDSNKNFLNSKPGTVYKYSNMGSALTGYLVEVIAKMPFDEYCNTKIFNTLCMDKTAWYLDDLNVNEITNPYKWENNKYSAIPHYGFADYPNGQLRSSINNLANFAFALLQNGTFNNKQLLTGANISEMLKVQNPTIDDSQGLAFYTKEVEIDNGNFVTLWGHNGGEDGATTDLYINPTNNIGVIVLSNARASNDNVIEELYNHALTLTSKGIGNPTCAGVGILSTDNNLVNKQKIILNQISIEGQFSLISKQETIKTVSVYNTLGQLVFIENLNNKTANFTIGTKGLYFVNIITEEGNRHSYKIIRK